MTRRLLLIIYWPARRAVVSRMRHQGAADPAAGRRCGAPDRPIQEERISRWITLSTTAVNCTPRTSPGEIAERLRHAPLRLLRATLERHWHAFDDAFGAHPHLVCFAVKANSTSGC